MCSIGPLVLEIDHEEANILVAGRFAVSVTEMSKYLPLKDVLVCAIAGSTKHLESPEFVLIIVSTARFSYG
jgi:hypothetical protein